MYVDTGLERYCGQTTFPGRRREMRTLVVYVNINTSNDLPGKKTNYDSLLVFLDSSQFHYSYSNTTSAAL